MSPWLLSLPVLSSVAVFTGTTLRAPPVPDTPCVHYDWVDSEPNSAIVTQRPPSSFEFWLPSKGPCANASDLTVEFHAVVLDAHCRQNVRPAHDGPIGHWESCMDGALDVTQTLIRQMTGESNGWTTLTDDGTRIFMPLSREMQLAEHGAQLSIGHVNAPYLTYMLNLSVYNSTHTMFGRSWETQFAVVNESAANHALGFFNWLHDSSVATAVSGQIQLVLELERWTGQPGYVLACTGREMQEVMRPVIHYITGVGRSQTPTFDVLVLAKNLEMGASTRRCENGLRQLMVVDRIEYVDHHRAHATLAMYEALGAGFDRALIFSYDGLGNDGTFVVFEAEPMVRKLDLLKSEGIEFGSFVHAARPVGLSCAHADAMCIREYGDRLMAYASLGQANYSWLEDAEAMWRPGRNLSFITMFIESHEPTGTTELYSATGRALAATVQKAFETTLVNTIAKYLDGWTGVADLDSRGIVLTGGCAYNIFGNQRVFEAFPSIRLHVSVVPGDSGQVVGLVWAVTPPMVLLPWTNHIGPFVGPTVFDADKLPEFVRERSADAVGSEWIAQQLADEAVVAVLRGRMEWGPRALGHRSVLGYAGAANMSTRLRQLNRREWFRPIGAVLPAEDASDYLADTDAAEQIVSPYMSFAAPLKPEVLAELGEMGHVDGTVRLQTCRHQDEPWLHALLLLLRRLTGHAVVLNTSFRANGRPMLNNIATALALLDEHAEISGSKISGLLVDDWWFDASTRP